MTFTRCCLLLVVFIICIALYYGTVKLIILVGGTVLSLPYEAMTLAAYAIYSEL